MADNATKIAALQSVLDTGATDVSVDGERVRYDPAAIRRRIRDLKTEDVYEGMDYALAKMKVSQLFALAFFRDAEESMGDVTGGDSGADLDEDGEDDGDRSGAPRSSDEARRVVSWLICGPSGRRGGIPPGACSGLGHAALDLGRVRRGGFAQAGRVQANEVLVGGQGLVVHLAALVCHAHIVVCQGIVRLEGYSGLVCGDGLGQTVDSAVRNAQAAVR